MITLFNEKERTYHYQGGTSYKIQSPSFFIPENTPYGLRHVVGSGEQTFEMSPGWQMITVTRHPAPAPQPVKVSGDFGVEGPTECDNFDRPADPEPVEYPYRALKKKQ